MDFLGVVNRVLQMCKQTYVDDFSGVSLGDDAYNVQTCVNDTLDDLSNILKVKTRMINFSLTTIVNQRTYTMPRRILFPVYSLRQSANDIKLKQMNTQDFDFHIPDDDNYGSPEVYYLDNFSGVASQPSSTVSTGIDIVSSDASDTSTITIQGYDSSGYYVSEEVILTGTTTVVSTNVFLYIEKVSKDITDGNITLSENGGSTHIVLGAQEKSISVPVIGLHPIPSSIMTISGRGWMRIPELVNELDRPLGLEDNAANAVMLGTYARYLRYDTTNKYETINGAFGAYYDEVKKLIAYDTKDLDLYRRMRQPRESRRHMNRFNPLDRSY